MKLSLVSFGYKAGLPPPANFIFDVRFLKNPFWDPKLRPLNGCHQEVQEFVLIQEPAAKFLDELSSMLSRVLPQIATTGAEDFMVALGCTGGQHRSPALIEALAKRLHIIFPHYLVLKKHRELKDQKGENNP